MAINIPRANPARPVQQAVAQAPARPQAREQGMNAVASTVDRIGEGLRNAQAKADAAWANATVYSERRIAEEIAAEEGLAGKDYELFMDSRVRRAREAAVERIRLPESKRAVSNSYQQQAEADQLEFAAQGRQKELEQSIEQYETTTDLLRRQSQNTFLMDESGEIDPTLYQLASDAELAADGVPFQGDRQAEENRNQTRSDVAFTAGREIILGYTRNGNGKPGEMLEILTNEKHELNKLLTEEDNFRLRQLALQKLDSMERAGSARRTATEKRIREMTRQLNDSVDGKMPVNENTIIELDRHIGQLQSEYPNIDFGQYKPGWELTIQEEGARQTIYDAMQAAKTLDVYQNMRFQPASVVEGTVAQMEAMWSQAQDPVLPNKGTMDSVTLPDGTTMETGEYQERMALYRGAKMRLNELNNAEQNGTLPQMYVRENGGSPAGLISIRDFDEAVETDRGPMMRSVMVLRQRMEDAAEAAEAYGRRTTLWQKDEASLFEEGIANGELQTGEIMGVLSTFSDMAGIDSSVVQESMRMVSEDNRPWMRAAVYAMDVGNNKAAQRIIEGRRVDTTKFFSNTGDKTDTEMAFSRYIDRTTIAGSTEQKDLLHGFMSLLYGKAPQKVDNTAPGSDEIETVISDFFPNGADVEGERFYPRPSGKGPGGSELVVPDIIDGLRPSYLEKGTLPAPALRMDVDEDFTQMDANEQVIESIQNGEVRLVPDLSQTGVYLLVMDEPQMEYQINDRSFLIGQDGRPLRWDFNNWYQRSSGAATWQAPGGESWQSELEGFMQGDQ